MFRNPNVIAAAILGAAIFVSSMFLCNAIASLATILDHKPMGGFPNPGFPGTLTLTTGNDVFNVRLHSDGTPLLVKQVQ